MKHQLSLLDEADEVFVESWLTDMLDKGQAELTEDGGFRISADYYKELPRNDRHYESMTEILAVEVMSALIEAGVQLFDKQNTKNLYFSGLSFFCLI